MTYNADVRREIKAEQKEIARANRGKIIGAQVICALPMALISVIMMVWYFKTMGSLFGASFQSEIDHAMNSLNDMSTLVSVLQLLVGAPLTLGLMSFFIRLMRGEETTAGSVLHPLTSIKTVFRSIRMALVLWLRTMIWLVGPTILMSIILSVTLISGITPSGSFTGDAIIGVFVIVILFYLVIMLISVKISMYQAGYIHLHDNEFIGTWDAARVANEGFRGRYKDLLVFFLSFAPWYLLYFALLFLSGMPLAITVAMAGDAITSGVILGGLATIVLCILVVLFLGSFITAYQNMSFLRLYERIAPAPEQPADYSAFQVAAQPWQQESAPTPEQPETAPEPEEEPEKEPSDQQERGNAPSED